MVCLLGVACLRGENFTTLFTELVLLFLDWSGLRNPLCSMDLFLPIKYYNISKPNCRECSVWCSSSTTQTFDCVWLGCRQLRLHSCDVPISHTDSLTRCGSIRYTKYTPETLWHSLLLSPFPSLSGWGRWRNSEYQQFISILEETRKNHTPSNKVTLLWQQLVNSWPVSQMTPYSPYGVLCLTSALYVIWNDSQACFASGCQSWIQETSHSYSFWSLILNVLSVEKTGLLWFWLLSLAGRL